MVQNDKKLCLLRSISQEPYIIWLSFMVQMCKVIISPGVFFNFKILIFRVVGAERAKNGPKLQKILPVSLRSQESYIILLSFLVHMCQMMISPASFFIFQNFGFGDFMGVKEQKMT